MGAPVTSLAMSMDSVFAAAGNFVGRYVRGKEVGRMVVALPKDDDDSSDDEDESMDSDDDDAEDDSASTEILTNLSIFGTTLLALSHDGRKMYVWDIPTYVKPASNPGAGPTPAVTPYATIEFAPDFTATKLVHPATYLNKVVVASKEGSLSVWNIRTASVAFRCESDFETDQISTAVRSSTLLSRRTF